LKQVANDGNHFNRKTKETLYVPRHNSQYKKQMPEIRVPNNAFNTDGEYAAG